MNFSLQKPGGGVGRFALSHGIFIAITTTARIGGKSLRVQEEGEHLPQ
jgi:hypothetical protein